MTTEERKAKRAGIAAATRALLFAIGEDIDREGLLDTPRRVADMWIEFIDHDPGRIDTVFQAEATDQMVAVTQLRVWSMCEHHLLPFWCDVSVAYLATDKVIGLSKIGRITRKHAHQLQLQERLIDGIARELVEVVGDDVAVIGTGEHLCMTMRGVAMPHRMTSSVMLGRFREPALRAEFLAVVAGAAR